MPLAITRNVSGSLARCELVHREREPIDVGRARLEHAAYEGRLAELGCRIERLPEEPEMPDAVFVEDAAVVLDELAVLTRPGAASRRGETESVASVLAAHRPLARIEAPGTLDGGDVLRLGRRLFVGRSRRTDAEGIRQLEALVEPFGYAVRTVPVTRCLHLKSAATPIGENVVLFQREWVDAGVFGEVDLLEADPGEPGAANALWLGSAVIHADGYPRTQALLRDRGLRVLTVAFPELTKAEAGVTCCSLILSDPAR